MHRASSLSVALALLLYASAFADVGQLQKHFVSSIHEVTTIGGPRAVGDAASEWFGHPQFAADPVNGGTSSQTENGGVTQSAVAIGQGGDASVVQEGGTWGVQQQIDNGVTKQDQVTDVEAFHEALAGYGVDSGRASCVQNVGANQIQRSSSNTQDQSIGMAPGAAVYAGLASLAVSRNDMYAVGDQSQVATQ